MYIGQRFDSLIWIYVKGVVHPAISSVMVKVLGVCMTLFLESALGTLECLWSLPSMPSTHGKICWERHIGSWSCWHQHCEMDARRGVPSSAGRDGAAANCIMHGCANRLVSILMPKCPMLRGSVVAFGRSEMSWQVVCPLCMSRHWLDIVASREW